MNSVMAPQGTFTLLVYMPEHDLRVLVTMSVITGARDQCSRVFGVEAQSVDVWSVASQNLVQAQVADAV